jgi:hypothetical protein
LPLAVALDFDAPAVAVLADVHVRDSCGNPGGELPASDRTALYPAEGKPPLFPPVSPTMVPEAGIET